MFLFCLTFFDLLSIFLFFSFVLPLFLVVLVHYTWIAVCCLFLCWWFIWFLFVILKLARLGLVGWIRFFSHSFFFKVWPHCARSIDFSFYFILSLVPTKNKQIYIYIHHKWWLRIKKIPIQIYIAATTEVMSLSEEKKRNLCETKRKNTISKKVTRVVCLQCWCVFIETNTLDVFLQIRYTDLLLQRIIFLFSAIQL